MHTQQRKEYYREYYKKNKVKRRADQREYYKRNLAYYKIYNKNYNKFKRSAISFARNRKKMRERSQVLVKELNDKYIERLLVQRHGIDRKDLTKHMVELKRKSLILFREKKESKIFIRKLLGLTIKKPKIAESGENPCRICKLIDQDKNSLECTACNKRIEYLSEIG